VETKSPSHDELRRMRVSDLLAAHPGCLDVLVRYGFTPLRQPALRRVLARTVDLGQAVLIRGLTAEDEASLLVELEGLLAGRSTEPAPTSEPARRTSEVA
jgi:hypothetical protein